jgi:peroxiredoxin Q/BCP
MIKMAVNEINVGDKAPIFKLDSYNAGTINLSELIGKQKVVLIFSRYFGCPICQLDLKTLLERSKEIENKGANILYITQSGEKVAKQFIEQKSIPFPVILSTKDELYKDYGLGPMVKEAAKQVRAKVKEAFAAGFEHGDYEGWEAQCPGQFVIDIDGKIIHAKPGWLEIDPILEVL